MSISPGTMTIGILAILAGLIGAYAIRTALEEKEAPAVAAAETITVPLATTDLPEGRTIAMGDVALAKMTKEEMEEKKMPMDLMMLEPDQIIGRTLKSSLKNGQPFLTTSMYLEGMQPTVSDKLKPGHRAFTLEVPRVQGGTVAPGTNVDVIFRSFAREADGDMPAIPEATMTLIQSAEVLKVEQPKSQENDATLDIRALNRTNQQQKDPLVTLAVTAEQANMLRTVEGRGELSLAARAPSDAIAPTDGKSEKLTLENLLGVDTRPTQTFVTEIYRGGARDTNTFRGDFRVAPKTPAPRDVVTSRDVPTKATSVAVDR